MLAELSHGVEKSAMVSYNLCKVEDFVSRLAVLPCQLPKPKGIELVKAPR